MKISLLVLLLISAFGSPSFGQKSSNSSDQALRGSGRVNPSTLGLEFDLPLASYPGRGINVPISISYSSKQWRMESEGSIDGGIVTGGCRTLYHPRFSERSASGWTTSLAVPYIEYTDLDNFYNGDGFPYDFGLCVNAPPDETGYSWVRRLTVHLPSGESHELRADDQILNYSPSSVCPPSGGYTCDPNTKWLQSNWNATFYAVDGSNIKYVENSNTNTYVLYMPDGSSYEFENSRSGMYNFTARKANKFVDRNGNYTTYNSSTGVWTDTLGRTLASPMPTTAPAVPQYDQDAIVYSLQGMTGTYKFHWKKLKDSTAATSALTDFNQDLKYTGDKIAQTTNGNWSSHPSGTYLFHSNFSQFVQSDANVFNPILLTKIELPTGESYEFSYNIYGLIERIKYPTGGEEKFVHGQVAPLTQPAYDDEVTPQANFGVTNRKLYVMAGSGTPYEWSYSALHVDPSGFRVSVTNPDGTKNERFLHQGDPPCSGSCPKGTYGFDNVLAGMLYEERSFSNSGQIMSRKLMHWTKKTFTGVGGPPKDWHPRVTHEESIIYDSSGNGVSATVKYEYEGILDLRETPVMVNKTTQYAFVPIEVGGGGQSLQPELPGPDEPPDPDPTPIPTPVPPTPVKIVETTYLINDPNYAGVKSYYTAQNMNGLVTASQVKDGAGTIVSRTETVYDESGRSPGYRGNPTSLRVWDSTKGIVTNTSAYISTSAKFDTYGNQYEATDARGCTTATQFDGSDHAFPIQVTSCTPSDGTYGSNSAFVTTATFDPITGLPETTTDANGLKTEITYDPVTLRPLNTKTYYGGNQVGSTAETIYHDEPGNYWVKNRAQIDTNIWAESITYFDGLGRAWKTEEVNSNGNIFVEKEFDAEGRVLRVSNPFRAGETKVWTTNVYDEASRVKEVVLQDGAKIITDYGVSTSGVIGVTKQITDQAGKKRKGISDALGRMVRVIEDPTGQNLSTDYVFDTLGNLRKTIQGEQNRFFMHDSLGRLLYAKQPEQDANSNFVATDPITNNSQWSVKYLYDDNGNITTTTDARNDSITATYDSLNRLKVRDYSDPNTPDVSFYYDGKYLDLYDTLQTATGSVNGKTTGVKSAISKANYTSFDNLGRLLTHQQITDGQTYSTEYEYNLSGGLVSETYPSGRTVNYEINADGDLSRVWGENGSTITTYANAFNYNVNGAVEKLRLGNGKWETAQYNNRLQITQIGLGTGSSDTSLLKLEYSYNTTGQTNNNGSLREQKITVPGAGGTSGFTATQTYTYDDLNRLQVAEEKVAGNTTWKQTLVIDRYGNREFDAANTTTLGSCTQAVCNPDINTANNRFSSGQGYAYDQNGNVTQDAEGKRFGYDGENHQKEFFSASNPGTTPDATYSYDGEGRRIKKVTATETTVFVYNASGQLVAEYSTQISQTPQVSYLTTDHLGSPRVVTDQLGAVKDRKDYSAFGEETISAQRQSALGYTASGDELRKGYTGYEKDSESGLDFARARYYNSTHGRYTSIDPLTASIETGNPQTFNRYAYVLNSPYILTDPLGLSPQGWRDYDTGACGAENASCDDFYDDRTEFERLYDTVIQTETRTYTVVQTEADGRQATITITSVVTRTIDRLTGRQISPTSNPTVTSTARNTGSANFSSTDLGVMQDVARDIVYVANKTGRDARLFLAMAQRETHLGIGAIGDPRNVGKPEMKGNINPLQLDGAANLKYNASSTDRLYNIEMSMQLFQENASAARTTNLTDALSVYNSGKRAKQSSKGAAYAADIIRKSSAITEKISLANKRLFGF